METVILVTTATATATAMDTVSGPVYMSYVEAPAHTSTVNVYVGSLAIPSFSAVTLVWDEDILKPGGDPDGDGLGNGLEAAIGTNPSLRDTDNDGIPDGIETLGKESFETAQEKLTRFPYMGSDPLLKDLFIQADWTECVNRPECPNNSKPDYWRMPADTAIKVANLYAIAGIRVHVDTGLANADPATLTTYGAWLGAERKPVGFDRMTTLFARDKLFHRGLILPSTGGGQAGMPGWSFSSGNGYRAVSHESGHNLGLNHGPRFSGGLKGVNCQPNYVSVMNYAVHHGAPAGSDPPFSANEFANAPLTPKSVNELAGLNTTVPAKLARLGWETFGFSYNSSGAVDWNRDGIYSSGSVRAAVTWGKYHSCDVASYGLSIANDGQGSALGWIRGNVLNGNLSSLNKLYWFTRGISGPNVNKPLYRSQVQTLLNPVGIDPMVWSPPVSSGATPVPNALPMASEPTVAPYVDSSGKNRLFLFYTSNNSLYAQSTDGSTWTSPVNIGPGAGDPAAVNYNGQVRVYVRRPDINYLASYVYTSNSWVGPTIQTWDPGTLFDLISVSQGIGVTTGYIRTSSSAPSLRLVALIPLSSPAGQVEFAVYNDSTGRWEKRPNSFWFDGSKPITTSRPSIAYVPFVLSDRPYGRFYLAWSRNTGGGKSMYSITFTQGNDMRSGVTTRVFQVKMPPVNIRHEWLEGVGSVSLLNDLDFDTNMRAAWTFDSPHGKEAQFSKVADQIFDGVLKDQNDYQVIPCFLGHSINPQMYAPCVN